MVVRHISSPSSLTKPTTQTRSSCVSLATQPSVNTSLPPTLRSSPLLTLTPHLDSGTSPDHELVYHCLRSPDFKVGRSLLAHTHIHHHPAPSSSLFNSSNCPVCCSHSALSIMTAAITSPSINSPSSSSSMLSSSKVVVSPTGYKTAPRTMPDPHQPSSAEMIGDNNPSSPPLDGAVPVVGPAPPGVKLACASCIRGHRTSSCTHKDGSKGPLYPIRSKGRPPTQCDICRQKRKESGRHVRCDCAGKKQPQPEPLSLQRRRSSKGQQPAPESNPTSRKRKSDDSQENEAYPQHSTVRVKGNSSASSVSGPSGPHKYAYMSPFGLTNNAQEASWQAKAQQTFGDWQKQFPILPPILDSKTINPLQANLRNLPSMSSISIDKTQKSSDSDVSRPPRDRSSLSLSSLMNPCQCRTTGYCVCCRDSSKSGSRAQAGSAATGNVTSSCCTEDHCCRLDDEDCPGTVRAPSASGGCCSKGRVDEPASRESLSASPRAMTKPGQYSSSSGSSSPSGPSIELLLRAVDMSSEFVPPKCQCNDFCRCASCLSRSGKQSKTSPSGDQDCDSCVACDLTLTKPSGIQVVDQWIEANKSHTSDSADSGSRRPSPTSSAPRASSVSSQSAASEGSAAVLHGGLLTSSTSGNGEVRAELVMVHPGCATCLEVVRKKGVGILCPDSGLK